MEIFKFFNSAPDDPRTYQASDFANYFARVLSTGLLHTDNIPAMEVKCEGTDLRTYVEPGMAIMEGYAYENTSDLYLQHALPEATLDRIDRIVLRLDKRNQYRFIKLFVKQGVAAAAPVPPDLQRDEFIYELSLAQITVRANTSVLDPADLVDERLDEQLCGFVSSLIRIPTSQFQAEWDAFMAGIQDEGFASQTDFNAHLADDVNHVRYAIATGTANTYAVTLDPVPTAYVEGMAIAVKINVNASEASTLNVNGLGAKGIKKSNGTDVTNLKANGIYTLRYDGVNFILQGEGGSGNATASDLLSGKTATTDAGEIIGTMPNRGVFNLGLGVPVPEGYYSGGTTASGKRFATGTSPDSSNVTFRGLPFRPSTVVIDYVVGGAQYRKVYNNNPTIDTYIYSSLSTVVSGGAWTIYDDGFTTGGLATTGTSITWTAFE